MSVRNRSGLRRKSAYAVLSLISICLPLAPLSPGGPQASADLFFCVTIVWVLRSPGSAPVWMIIPFAILADILLSGPVGLGAFFLLLATELVRGNKLNLRELHFLFQWLAVWLIFTLMLFGEALVLRLVFMPSPDLQDILRTSFITGITYPLIWIALSRIILPYRGTPDSELRGYI